MQAGRMIIDWLMLRSAKPELVLAQFGELQRQIPMLYALLGVNAVAVAYTHLDVAPVWMTVWIPGVLITLSAIRMIAWVRRPHLTRAEDIVRQLRLTTLLGSLVALAYISWSLLLGAYGGDQHQAHVAIFIAITVIGCIFCLMHLPQAALAVTAIVTVPYLVYYLSSGDAVYVAIGLNILLVTFVMIRVLLNSFSGFETLIRTQGETERLNREVTALAHTDMLTGLPNRRHFFGELDDRLARWRTTGLPLALGVIDLDRFKAANDTFGHILGDQLLEAVGKRLREVFGPDRMVARLGGDEFAFVVELDGPAAHAVANNACEALSLPFKLGDITVSIGASCGLATAEGMLLSAKALYVRADYALYNAKSVRRGFATLYSCEHEKQIRSEHAVEAALQAADLDREMDVHVQPIVRLGDGAVIAVEALARWCSPTLGSVRPDIFIPLAERAGMIHRLTLTLFAKALALLDRLPAGVALSFNLSAHDLASRETVLGMVSLVQSSGADPSRLILELTETAVMRDFAAAEDSIRLLRALGACIALDDFGTGQSSLSYLNRLPIDRVKIDRSFVVGASEPAGRDLLTAVVALCHSMRMSCIAEGVEDESQLAFLEDIGCDAFQGYLFAKPMPIGDLVAWHGARQEPRSPHAPAKACPQAAGRAWKTSGGKA